MDFSALRIVLVEDDGFVRGTLKRLLTSLGSLDVREAGDGTQALGLVRDRRPDLILCDIHMPPLDGPAFLRALRSSDDPQLARCPVIMLSAGCSTELAQDIASLGVSGYLLKPVSRKMLAERIAAALPPVG